MSAFAGFQNQIGTLEYTLPGSGTEQILMLSNSSNIGEPGVWVFRVDNEIQQGGSLYTRMYPYILSYGVVEFINNNVLCFDIIYRHR